MTACPNCGEQIDAVAESAGAVEIAYARICYIGTQSGSDMAGEWVVHT